MTVADKPRNVINYYAKWETEAIKADLDTKRVPLVNICMNLTNDFNKSNVVRSNNAFLGTKVYMVGNRRYDRRGAVGTQNYETIEHSENLNDVVNALRADGYVIYAVDNNTEHDPCSVWDVELPDKTAFVYGEEMRGLSEEEIALCDRMIFIPMFGSVRSLNVGTAAAIMMNEYARQHRALYENRN